MKRILASFSQYWTYALCAILIAAAGVVMHVGAQGPGEPEPRIAGMPTLKPVAPVVAPRPGQTGDQPWKTGRGEDTEPVSSFVDTLQGTDAAFQLVVGQSRLFTTREPIAKDGKTASIALSDPSVLEFEVLPNPRMVRLIGLRPGVTDLSFTTGEGKTYSFEVHVTYDLDVVRAQLRQTFPEAHLKLGQLREHLVVEGQARSTDQVARIVQFLEHYLTSIQRRSISLGRGGMGPAGAMQAGVGAGPRGFAGAGTPGGFADPSGTVPSAGVPGDPSGLGSAAMGNLEGASMGVAGGGLAGAAGAGSNAGGFGAPTIINLITVPGVQQVLLQVQIAELNRTSLREMGVDWLLQSPSTVLGTQLAGGAVNAGNGVASLLSGTSTTAFAIFPSGELSFMVRALRRNSVLNVLAEPNLVALNGQDASFLAGGEFAVPIPQVGGAGGGAAVTVQYKTFGVQLNFVPTILDDETIRLKVAPEASTLDYSIGTQVLGTQVPGLNSRRVNTTVELKQGQTLALAGLLTVQMDGTTSRIPLLGDLPYLGTMFRNTSHQRQEKELIVLVTPHLVTPMNPGQVPCLPGDDILAPNDLEFYLLGRIEGRTGKPFRPTTSWDNPLGMVELMKLERSHLCGPHGFSDVDE